MPMNLRMAILMVAIVLLLVIFRALSKKTIPVKYSFLWIISVIILILLALVPNTLIWFASKLGFQAASNLVIGVFLIILIFITISLTIIVSSQNRKITLLIQELSILKEKIKD